MLRIAHRVTTDIVTTDIEIASVQCPPATRNAMSAIGARVTRRQALASAIRQPLALGVSKTKNSAARLA